MEKASLLTLAWSIKLSLPFNVWAKTSFQWFFFNTLTLKSFCFSKLWKFQICVSSYFTVERFGLRASYLFLWRSTNKRFWGKVEQFEFHQPRLKKSHKIICKWHFITEKKLLFCENSKKVKVLKATYFSRGKVSGAMWRCVISCVGPGPVYST